MPASRIVLGALLIVLALASCATTPATVQAREWLAIGNAWAEKGEWARAGSAWARAVELDSKIVGASYNMVRAFAESGEYGKANLIADSLLADDPSNVRVLTLKAYSLARSGQVDAALAIYEKVLVQNPLSPDSVYNAALIKNRVGRRDEAISDLARLFLAVPEDTQAAILYGRLCDESGDDSTALTVYESIRKAGKADSAMLIRMGSLYESRGNYSGAMEALAAGTASAVVPPASSTAPTAAAATGASGSQGSTQGSKTAGSAASSAVEIAAAKQAAMAKALFSLARIRLSVAEDGAGGLAALDKAIALGFSDREAVTALLLLPVLAKREEVTARLKKAGLLP